MTPRGVRESQLAAKDSPGCPASSSTPLVDARIWPRQAAAEGSARLLQARRAEGTPESDGERGTRKETIQVKVRETRKE